MGPSGQGLTTALYRRQADTGQYLGCCAAWMVKNEPLGSDLVFVDLMKTDRLSPDSFRSIANSVCGPPHSSMVGDNKLLLLRKQVNPRRTAGLAASGAADQESKKSQLALTWRGARGAAREGTWVEFLINPFTSCPS